MIEHDWFCRSIYQRSDNVFFKFLKCILCAVSRHQSCHHDLNVKSTLKVFRKIKKTKRWSLMWKSMGLVFEDGRGKEGGSKEGGTWLAWRRSGGKGTRKNFHWVSWTRAEKTTKFELAVFFSSLPSCVSLFCWRPDFDSAFSFASACTKQVVCWQRQTNKTR